MARPWVATSVPTRRHQPRSATSSASEAEREVRAYRQQERAELRAQLEGDVERDQVGRERDHDEREREVELEEREAAVVARAPAGHAAVGQELVPQVGGRVHVRGHVAAVRGRGREHHGGGKIRSEELERGAERGQVEERAHQRTEPACVVHGRLSARRLRPDVPRHTKNPSHSAIRTPATIQNHVRRTSKNECAASIATIPCPTTAWWTPSSSYCTSADTG